MRPAPSPRQQPGSQPGSISRGSPTPRVTTRTDDRPVGGSSPAAPRYQPGESRVRPSPGARTSDIGRPVGGTITRPSIPAVRTPGTETPRAQPIDSRYRSTPRKPGNDGATRVSPAPRSAGTPAVRATERYTPRDSVKAGSVRTGTVRPGAVRSGAVVAPGASGTIAPTPRLVPRVGGSLRSGTVAVRNHTFSSGALVHGSIGACYGPTWDHWDHHHHGFFHHHHHRWSSWCSSWWWDPYWTWSWNLYWSPWRHRSYYWNHCCPTSWSYSWSYPCVTWSYYRWYPGTTYVYVPAGGTVVVDDGYDGSTTIVAGGNVVGSTVIDRARARDGAGRGSGPVGPEALAAQYVELGDFYFKAGRFPEALDAYGKARSYAPNDASVHFVLADAAFATGDYHYAAYLIAEGLRLDPSMASADTDKRLFYGDPAAFEEQLAALDRYLESKPYDAQAHLVKGYNLRFAGKPTAAIAVFRRVLEIAPENRAAQTFLAALAPESAEEPAIR